MKQNKSKYVESYWITEHESGIFHLMFNTTERWMSYHRYSDTKYCFGYGLKKIGETEEEADGEDFEIEEFLPKDKSYLPTVIQEKDQISWWFIPYDLIDRKSVIKNIK